MWLILVALKLSLKPMSIKILIFFTKKLLVAPKQIKIMGRPRKEIRYVHKAFKLPPELAEALEEYCAKNMVSISAIIRRAICEFIMKHGDGDDSDAIFNAIQSQKKQKNTL